MEKIAVIANNEKYAEQLADNFMKFFSGHAKFNPYGMNEIDNMDSLKEMCIILSSFTIFQEVKRKTDDDAKLIIADLTLDRSNLAKLYKLPKNAKALLVNIDYRHCMEVITMLYSAGFKSLELIPFYPGADFDSSVRIAITPGELDIIPTDITTVIDIGQRVIDNSSIFELAKYLGVEDPFAGDDAKSARENIFSFNAGMDKLLGKNNDLLEQINALLRLVRQGIMITDMMGKIYLTNDMAAQMLKRRTKVITGFNITEVLPEISDMDLLVLNDNDSSELINVSGEDIIVTIARIVSDGRQNGHIVTLEYFTDTENRQHKLRSKISGYGHKAIYTFDDILGKSPQTMATKKIAMRMAKSDSCICLFGESGSGKEMYAQSIHNFSKRKKYHFVAVNCSALPENLLESELYGYEEGAFSGAKKGGKIGLFELAHKGTLFLDEIGELPLTMQAKLLRAIEERKIIKVGGRDLIDVDVRIICATNRDLMEMVENKEFRSDLYYRLCVLPIYLPSLRQRKEDIMLFMDYMKENVHTEFLLDEEAERAMMCHKWPGNVRELKNIVEYLANLDKKIISKEDLPFKIKTNCKEDSEPPLNIENDTDITEFLILEKSSLDVHCFVLGELVLASQTNHHAGRIQLSEKSKEEGKNFTEQEIRTSMEKLSRKEFILSGKGRRGSRITDKGRSLYNNIIKGSMGR